MFLITWQLFIEPLKVFLFFLTLLEKEEEVEQNKRTKEDLIEELDLQDKYGDDTKSWYESGEELEKEADMEFPEYDPKDPFKQLEKEIDQVSIYYLFLFRN